LYYQEKFYCKLEAFNRLVAQLTAILSRNRIENWLTAGRQICNDIVHFLAMFVGASSIKPDGIYAEHSFQLIIFLLIGTNLKDSCLVHTFCSKHSKLHFLDFFISLNLVDIASIQIVLDFLCN